MNSINRRNFIKSSFAAGAAFSWPVHSWSQVQGANDDIRVAVIGFNGQGKSHIEGFRKMKGVRVVALCDADRAVLDREAGRFKEQNQPIETYTDIRKLLENKNIDAISTATPNHWHALASIWAIQAGKDVYVEKPVSHNVWEGRKIVEAARKYKRMVQPGTKGRPNQPRREAFAGVHEGKRLARGMMGATLLPRLH